MTPTPIAQLVNFASSMQANFTAIFGLMATLVISLLVLFWGFRLLKKKVMHVGVTGGDSYITRRAKNTSHRYTTGQVDTFLKFH